MTDNIIDENDAIISANKNVPLIQHNVKLKIPSQQIPT